MSSLLAIKKAFDERHDYSSEDLSVLQERWPEVKFVNIPDAWILILDTMLCRLRYDNPVREIRQEYGQLVVLHKPLRKRQKEVIQQAERQIYAVDADLMAEETDEKAQTCN